jgi:hypothetical protein
MLANEIEQEGHGVNVVSSGDGALGTEPAYEHADSYEEDPQGLMDKITKRMRSWFDEL